MDYVEFQIGNDFTCGNKRWRVTDIGRRVVVAIQVGKVIAVDSGARAKVEYHPDPSWFNGPPYAVQETVFDEADIPGCMP